MQKKFLCSINIFIVGLVMLRGLLYCLVIPFDQAPDERLHFLLIKAKHLQLTGASLEEKQRVASQIEFFWYRSLYPETKRTQENFTSGYLPNPPSSMHLYYFMTGWLLNVCSLEHIRDEIYLLRGFSILCGMIVIIFAILIAREVFPNDHFLRIGIPIFIAFVPQFSAMNGVINNDKLAEVFASLLFWILVNLFKNGLSWQSGAAYIIVALLGLMSKRTMVFILPLSLIALFVYYWKGLIGVKMHLFLFGGIFIITLSAYLLLWHPTLHDLVSKYVISIPESPYLLEKLFRPELFSNATLLYIAKFFTVMYWGFWGIFGNMTIRLHHFWYVVAAFAQSLAIAGLLKYTMHTKRCVFLSASEANQGEKLKIWQAKICYLFGVSIVLWVIIPVFRSIILRFDRPDLTQGRYLFTVMIPVSMLTMFGLFTIFPKKYHPWVGGIGLCAMLLFDTVAFINYLLLNFHNAAFF
ncbi:hypothetical protein U27_04874 [Candidatus Vecturithrix granuli]|uniref:Glycosyltransferase RgtA/B/C/D-like domain-containing protein n=1 Tax=Vecturithrix granuli TaxID=1499967 RepID=A0A081BZZ7_VECG1|nr:hypothetical protein U27_04874 [Candidatus Vecturithrix granuli]